MSDASVRDEAGGNWMPIAQSPFARLLPADPAIGRRQRTAGLLLAVVLVLLVAFFWYACDSYRDSAQKSDAAFCEKNLTYYQHFCASFPANCAEGPRKLARCEP